MSAVLPSHIPGRALPLTAGHLPAVVLTAIVGLSLASAPAGASQPPEDQPQERGEVAERREQELDRLLRIAERVRLDGFLQVRYLVQPGSPEVQVDRRVAEPRGVSGGLHTFALRQARIGLAGDPHPRVSYRVQMNAGAATGMPDEVGIAQAYVTVRAFGHEARENGNGPAPTATANVLIGLQPLPFGHHLQIAPATRIVPERYIGFSSAGAGLFPGQDYDLGLSVQGEARGVLEYQAGVFNGPAGPDRDFTAPDLVARVGVRPVDAWVIGVSGYLGHARERDLPIPPAVTLPPSLDRRLFGIETQWQPVTGAEFKAEYVRGRGGLRGGATLPHEYNLDPLRPFVEGATVQAFYLQLTHSPLPALTLALAYDQFNRNVDAEGAGPQQADFVERRLHAGAHYRPFDRTRVRLWFERPLAYPAFPARAAGPPRANLLTAEVQVSF
jgi:hypothetical protein